MSTAGQQHGADDIEAGIRNGVRAVITRDRKLLLLHKVYEDGRERYVLPGGAQDHGETLIQALQRECREEIDTEVGISGLLYVADFFKPRDKVPACYRQQLELFFQCTVPEHYQARNGYRPDKHQVSVVWVEQQELSRTRLFPASLAEILASGDSASRAAYLGVLEP